MSAAPAVLLSDLELDALTELVNLGVSNAALSLSQMVHEEVVLSVPRVSIVTRDEAIATLYEREPRLMSLDEDSFAGAPNPTGNCRQDQRSALFTKNRIPPAH